MPGDIQAGYGRPIDRDSYIDPIDSATNHGTDNTSTYHCGSYRRSNCGTDSCTNSGADNCGPHAEPHDSDSNTNADSNAEADDGDPNPNPDTDTDAKAHHARTDASTDPSADFFQ